MDWVTEGLAVYVTLVTGVLVILLYALCWGSSLLALLGGHLYLHARSSVAALGDDVPGVSIVKPLSGVDPLLEANLETHFTLTYPKFELLFCFLDDQDPAIGVVRKLQVKYPTVPVRLFWGGRSDIPNPLVQNFLQGYEAAMYDCVWVSSSKVQVSRVVMEDMVVKLQAPDVAVVHQLPFCLPGPSQHPMAHIVQQVYYGCGLGRHYVSFNTLGMACVAGLSYMVRRSMLERHCLDMQRYGQHVPHDFRLTKHLHQMGYKLVMSSFPAQQNVSLTSLGSFVDRMVRWSRLRYNALPVVGILEPLSECLPLGGLTSFFLFLFFGVRPLPFLCCHLTAWIVVDFLLLTQVQNGSSGISKFRFVCGWCLCQLVAVWIYVKAVCGLHRIRWGAHTYHVYTGGLVGKAYAI